VYKNHNDDRTQYDSAVSHRETGGWEAFLGHSEAEAVQKAMFWVQKWETTGKHQYEIVVGEINQKVARFNYTTVAFED
jgi:hypothetical protein